MQQDAAQPVFAEGDDSAASALPVVLFLLHFESQAGKEAAPNPHLGLRRLQKCLKALREHPVIPLVWEQPLVVSDLLMASPRLVALGLLSNTSAKKADLAIYVYRTQADKIASG